MTIEKGLLATIEAKPDKGEELGEFLKGAQEHAEAEGGTITWYAFKMSNTTYGIFDTFEHEDARQAHLTGPIPRALEEIGPDLLDGEPMIMQLDILAVKGG